MTHRASSENWIASYQIVKYSWWMIEWNHHIIFQSTLTLFTVISCSIVMQFGQQAHSFSTVMTMKSVSKGDLLKCCVFHRYKTQRYSCYNYMNRIISYHSKARLIFCQWTIKFSFHHAIVSDTKIGNCEQKNGIFC